MSNMNDNRSNVAEIQTYLRKISTTNKAIPEIAIDGIYGPETTNAVKSFQKSEGILLTGKVDLKTWEQLLYRYKYATSNRSHPNSISPFPSYTYVVKPDSKGDIVTIIQIMINTLNQTFFNINSVDVTGFFDDNTHKSIKQIQRHANIVPTGSVDKITWDILASAYNIYKT